MEVHAPCSGSSAVERVADEWHSEIRETCTDLMASAWTDQFDFKERCVRVIRVRALAHAPTTFADLCLSVRYSALVYCDFRAAFVSAGKLERERTTFVLAFNECEVGLSNRCAATTECVA